MSMGKCKKIKIVCKGKKIFAVTNSYAKAAILAQRDIHSKPFDSTLCALPRYIVYRLPRSQAARHLPSSQHPDIGRRFEENLFRVYDQTHTSVDYDFLLSVCLPMYTDRAAV